MMKKTALLLLTATLLMSTAACHNASTADNTPLTDSVVSQSTANDVSSAADTSADSSAPHHTSTASVISDTSQQTSVTKNNVSAAEPQTESRAADTDISPSTTEHSVSSTEEASAPDTSSESADVSVDDEENNTASETSQTEPSAVPVSNADSQPEIPSDTDDTQNSFLNVWTKVYAIDLQWQPQDNVDGYVIQCSGDSDFPTDRTKTQQTTDCSMTFDDLAPNTTYFVRACTYRLNGSEKVYSDWYTTDRAVLKSIEVIDGITYVDGLLIANKTYGLPESYGYGLTDETYQACNEMIYAAAADGISLWIESGFRSYETQSYTYQSFVWDRGTELADLCSARPGHSEHQSGMAIDFNTTSDAFAYTPEAAWIAAHCAEYGFIIRYPQGKEHITGYKYEPWHVRYVGREKAAAITASGLTVEEYYGITSFYQD